MEFDWLNTIQAREKFLNLHVVQWSSMLWFDLDVVFTVGDGM